MRISDWSSDVCSSDLFPSPSSHSGKLPPLIASHRSRRWKSGSAPLILTASFHITDCRPCLGFQWNLTKVERPSTSTSRKVWTPKPSIVRYERGIARSDMIHMIMWKLSGVRLTKSKKLRSEEHTSELQSLMRISYAGFCLRKKQHI